MKKVEEIRLQDICREEFEEWCEENGRNPEHKLSVIEYGATVLKNKEVAKLYEKVKKGEVKLENVILQKDIKKEIMDDKSKFGEKNVEGLKMILFGISRMAYDEEKGANDEFLKKSEEHINELIKKFYDTKNEMGLEVLVKGVIHNYGDELARLLDFCLTYLRDGQKVCDVAMILRKLSEVAEEGDE